MKTQFKVGSKVRVDSDNENYDSFRDKVLIVTHVATNTNEHPGYDSGLNGEALYDFRGEDGSEIPCSLYDYELVSA